MTSTRPEIAVPATAPHPQADPDAARRTYELDRAHVFHSWSAQAALTPLVVAGGQGSWVWDGDGTTYLDFSGQLVFTNLGFGHPAIVRAIQEQAALLATVAPQHANAARSEAARLIVERAPGHEKGERFTHVFFTNGGADAIEGAVHVFGPFLYRSAFHSTTEAEECERALQHLEQTIAMEGPATIAAIVLESIPGTAGIMVPPPGYLAGVREICDRNGIVWIADEVMSGFGRAGRWFACELGGAEPDLVTFAKGVNSGYVPLGGVLVPRQIYETFAQRPFPGGLTYSGHPLACAAAVAAITAMSDEGMIENADRLGREVLGPGLAEIADRRRIVGEVRGVGAFWALELVRDRVT